jgi:hypothetical protein
LLLRDGQVHHDTHPIPMGNYVIAVGNYVSVSPSDLGNYVSADIRDAVRRTDGLQVVAAQTFKHPRSSTAERLRAQADGRHYSTFSRYTPQELRAAIATFLARLPSPEVCWVDEHLLVVAGASRRNQVEPDGPGSRANQAIKDQALQISAGRAGQAPSRRPGGRAQITAWPQAVIATPRPVPDMVTSIRAFAGGGR